MGPILFVDGMNNFIRCFVVNQTMNSHGELYGGATGFLVALKNMVENLKPSLVLIAWEQGGGCPRRKAIYPEYKANRAKQVIKNLTNDRDLVLADQENKVKQITFLTSVLKTLPVIQLYVNDVEGDDIIGYLIRNTFRQDQRNKIIASSDKDFYQFLDDKKVSVFNPMTKHFVKQEDVITKYKIHPSNFVLARTIEGDASDNIAGVPGIGLKTVAKRFPELLEERVESFLPADLLRLSNEKIELYNKDKKGVPVCYQAIVDNMDVIKRNWKLMYIDSATIPYQSQQKINETYESNKNGLKIQQMEYLKNFSRHKIPISESFVQLTTPFKPLVV